MLIGGRGTINLVVIGLGAALVVFFAGATAAVAAGQTPPTALWAAGGAISGALIGLLVPPPGAKAGQEAAAAQFEAVATRATRAVEGIAEPHAVEAAQATAGEATREANALRVAAAQTPDTRSAMVVLLVLFVLLLALSVILAAGAIEPPAPFVESLKTVAAAVMTLASAAGTAVIGILAPSPTKGA
jgi:hypothetical protein